ncbi:MAG: hypothetical protein ACFFCW_18695 [Candidatus Hodarchaeota archaeon]
MKNQLNNKKVWLFKGKITKSSIAFSENKPNFKNIKIGVSSFMTSKYEISPAWRGKKQTQYKPNSNPIPERPKMNANIYYTSGYNNKTFFLAPNTKPNKAKVVNNQSSLIDNQLRRQTQFKPKFYPRFQLTLLFCRGTNPKQIYPRMSQSGGQWDSKMLVLDFSDIQGKL